MAASRTAASAISSFSTSATKRQVFSSFGFSGAGFLTCYHAGAAQCLLQQGFLLEPGERPTSTAMPSPPILTGVSGGALIACGLTAGVLPEDCMEATLHIARETRQLGGRLDSLMPGFSLLDRVENLFVGLMKEGLGGSRDSDDYDIELLQSRLAHSRLRVGFTDRRVFPPFGQNPRAYFYIDAFRNVHDMGAAALLSSYVPGITGPAMGSQDGTNHAVKQAKDRIEELLALGCIKHGETGAVVRVPNSVEASFGKSREIYWDGGLVNVWPVVDESTVIITPIGATFTPNPYISPAVHTRDQESIWERLLPRTIRVNSRTQLHVSPQNLETLRRIVLSSDEGVLHERFAMGYDDARYGE